MQLLLFLTKGAQRGKLKIFNFDIFHAILMHLFVYLFFFQNDHLKEWFYLDLNKHNCYFISERNPKGQILKFRIFELLGI